MATRNEQQPQLGDDEKRRRYPRGHFEYKDSWTKDTSLRYMGSMAEKLYWPLAKGSVLLAFGYGLRLCDVGYMYVIAACMLATWIYPYIVALCFGKIAMGAMDRGTFTSSKRANVNFMSVTGWDGDCFDDPERVKQYFKFYLDSYENFNYKIVSIFGDYYYEKISKEEAMEKGVIHWTDPKDTLKDQHEIESFVQDNINTKLPLDGPRFRAWFQHVKDDDGKRYFIQIWK